jgi:hypothetical protein
MMRAETGIRAPAPALTTGTKLEAWHVMAAHQDTTTRVCRKCGEEKLLDAFVACPRHALGRRTFCKECGRRQAREYTRNRAAKRYAESAAVPAGVVAPDTRILDDSGRDWAWAFVIFREIPDRPGYVVGSDASVWSRRKRGYQRYGPKPLLSRWTRLKTLIDKDGYHFYCLSVDGSRCRVRAHSLLLSTFISAVPAAGMVCCHRDDNPTNNRFGNLYWGTVQQNSDDRCRNGRGAQGERIVQSKLTAADVIEIRRLRSEGVPKSVVCSRFGINPTHVKRITNRTWWKHV